MSEPLYLIWSHEHHLWWKPGRNGYTRDLWQAGRYTWAEADKECRQRSWEEGNLPPEVMVLAPEDDHLTFTAAELRNIESLMNVRIGNATDMARERQEAGGMSTRDEMLASLAASLDMPPEIASGQVGAGSRHYASWLPDGLEMPPVMHPDSRACDPCYRELPDQYRSFPTICPHRTWEVTP